MILSNNTVDLSIVFICSLILCGYYFIFINAFVLVSLCESIGSYPSEL